MTNAITLDIREFREWLGIKRPDETVGKRQCSGECPLAAFLADQGAPYSLVWRDRYRLSWDHPMLPAPEWVGRFVKAADRGPFGSGIRAETCLRILDEIQADDPGFDPEAEFIPSAVLDTVTPAEAWEVQRHA